MRVLLSVIMAIGLIVSVFGQEENKEQMKTIFGGGEHKISNGGYAAFSVGYTQIRGEDAMMLGGRAGWLIDHHVTLGLAGNAFVNSILVNTNGNGTNVPPNLYLVGGYGGFFVEPIIAPNFPVHVSIPIMIGGGGLALNEYTWHDNNWENNYYYEPYDWDSYFVLEPGVEVEMNVVKYFRIAVGGSYRYTSNLHISYVPKDMMCGFNGYLTFKFGKF